MAATPNWSSARHPFGCIMMPTPAARSVSDLSNTMLFIPFLQNTTNTYYLLIHCILNGLIASLFKCQEKERVLWAKKKIWGEAGGGGRVENLRRARAVAKPQIPPPTITMSCSCSLIFIFYLFKNTVAYFLVQLFRSNMLQCPFQISSDTNIIYY